MTSHPASAASTAVVTPAMPPPMTRMGLPRVSRAWDWVMVRPLALAGLSRLGRHGSPFGVHDGRFDLHALFAEQAEPEPLHREVEQLLVVLPERVQPRLVDLEQVEEPCLEDEASEGVDVVAGGEVHRELLGRQG